MRKREVDRPLRRDVRMLGRLLGEVLVEQEGESLYLIEEQVRQLAISSRRGPREGRAAAGLALGKLLAGLPADRAEPVIRAFAAYFQLVNLAEQHHRIRRARAHASNLDTPPQRGSLAAVLLSAKDAGVSAADARSAIAALEVTLTLTAHPTQAQRRTVLEKIDRIANVLEEKDRCTRTPAEAEEALLRVREEITALWQTDEVRRDRPTVGDEVKNVLWYVEEVLFNLLPEVPRALADAFRGAYGEELGMIPSPLRLHSWVGGDMDGNPLVTPEVMEDAMRAHKARGLRRILQAVEELGGRLSQSARIVDVPAALTASLEADAERMPEVASRYAPGTAGEPWRRKLRFIEARLAAGLADVESLRVSTRQPDVHRLMARVGGGDEVIDPNAVGIAPGHRPPAASTWAYGNPEELLADLELVKTSLEQAGGPRAGGRVVQAVVEQVRALGFHILELEMRAPAEDALAAAAWLDGKAKNSEAGIRFFEGLRKIAEAQAEGGERACRTVVLSMANSAEDVFATLRCARAAGLWDDGLSCARIDVVPLFETLEALDQGPKILSALFSDPVYRRHVACRGAQEVMVGYSDSGKEVGLLAASGALRRAQVAMPQVAAAEGIPLRIFHGRGESVARGGGPAQQAIMALPPGSVSGRYKATEQGEALDHKYARPQLAMRTLELIIGGALLHTLDAQPRPDDETLQRYQKVYDKLGEWGRQAYRSLVWEEPRFVEFFTEASPVEEISHLPIGSRPSKRRAGGIEALRAIPWVFAWTQNRAILPGWYGVGSALEAFAESEVEGGTEMLSEMYWQWPFFRAVIDNVSMVLAKSDLSIASRYAALASPEARKAVWPRIRSEHRRTRNWIEEITGQRLLGENWPLRRSIRLRNPYVDPMSYLQVELLRRKRQGDERCDRPLLLTLNGIASGMRNTG